MRSHFNYTSLVWSLCKAKHVDLLKLVQPQMTRQLPRMKNLIFPKGMGKEIDVP